MLVKKLIHQPSARRRILRERLTEPLHLNVASLFVAAFGSVRSKIAFDLIQRPHYAYGLLEAADQIIGKGGDESIAALRQLDVQPSYLDETWVTGAG